MRQIMIEICDGHLRPSQVKQRRESIFSALYEASVGGGGAGVWGALLDRESDPHDR